MGFLEVAVFVAVVIIVLVHQILASIRKKTAGWSAIKHTDIIDSPLFSSEFTSPSQQNKGLSSH